MRSVRIGLLVALLLVLGACGRTQGAPPRAPANGGNLDTKTVQPHATLEVAPGKWPTTWRYDASVSGLDLRPGGGLARTLVPKGPSYATICRYAGFNEAVKAGTLQRSRVLSGTVLVSFVSYLDEPRQVVPLGVSYNCPLAVGLVDLMLFRYRSGASLAVSVDIDGCPFVSNGVLDVWGGDIGQHLARWVGSDPLPQ